MRCRSIDTQKHTIVGRADLILKAILDMPAVLFEELIDIYPDAKVILTNRPVDGRSMENQTLDCQCHKTNMTRVDSVNLEHHRTHNKMEVLAICGMGGSNPHWTLDQIELGLRAPFPICQVLRQPRAASRIAKAV